MMDHGGGNRAFVGLRFTLWSLPGWIGMLSLWGESAMRTNYDSWLWFAASRGMFLLLLTPICVIFILREWARARGFRAIDHAVLVIVGAPTFVAALGALALLFQTFVGVPL